MTAYTARAMERPDDSWVGRTHQRPLFHDRGHRGVRSRRTLREPPLASRGMGCDLPSAKSLRLFVRVTYFGGCKHPSQHPKHSEVKPCHSDELFTRVTFFALKPTSPWPTSPQVCLFCTFFAFPSVACLGTLRCDEELSQVPRLAYHLMCFTLVHHK